MASNTICQRYFSQAVGSRKKIVLHLRPARRVARVTWLSPQTREEGFALDFERTSPSSIRVELPTLDVAGVVRVRYAS